MYTVLIYSFCIYVCISLESSKHHVSLEGSKHHVSLGTATFFSASCNASQASEHFPYIKRTRGELPYTKRLHKGIPRVIRSLADLASVKRISFTSLLYGYTLYPSFLWIEGRSFITSASLWRSFCVRKGICSAVESRGSDGNGGRRFEMTRRERLRPSANLENNTRQS